MPSPHRYRPGLHPAHAILLSFPIVLFAAALASDITFLNSGEPQWSNISQWAITGALIFGAPVMLWAAIALLRHRGPALHHHRIVYFTLVTVMWIIGLINAFKHSQDGWSSVGTAGLLLSILCTILALAAGWVAHSTISTGDKA